MERREAILIEHWPASAGVGDAGTWGRGAADPETPALVAAGRPRRFFLKPIETIEARSMEDARRCLDRIESSRRRLDGPDRPWVSGWVGFVSYEWGRRMLLGPQTGTWGRGAADPETQCLPLIRFSRVCVDPSRTFRGTERADFPRHRLRHSSDRRGEYLRKIGRIQEELRRGNVYEVNLSQRWTWQFDAEAQMIPLFSELSRAMRPRFGYADLSGDGTALLCFSPERFFSVRSRRIMAEPIKGTSVTRGALLRSGKERAELLMITDLFRNDFGRICRPGSIRAEGPFVLELPYAFHLFSRVRGTLTPMAGVAEVLTALFPSASVTGAPKLAAVRLIDRLEPFRREEAFGAIGWIGKDRMEFAVSIRTALYRRRRLRYTSGGGITIYSDPKKEYEESLLKAVRVKETLARLQTVS